ARSHIKPGAVMRLASVAEIVTPFISALSRIAPMRRQPTIEAPRRLPPASLAFERFTPSSLAFEKSVFKNDAPPKLEFEMQAPPSLAAATSVLARDAPSIVCPDQSSFDCAAERLVPVSINLFQKFDL